jgi:hypothetical protein
MPVASGDQDFKNERCAYPIDTFQTVKLKINTETSGKTIGLMKYIKADGACW